MVRVQLLLRREARTPDGLAAVKERLASLGLTAIGAGAATLSVEVAPEQLQKLFGVTTQDVTPSRDIGSSKDLSVPAPLRELVESITIAPHHLYFPSK